MDLLRSPLSVLPNKVFGTDQVPISHLTSTRWGGKLCGGQPLAEVNGAESVTNGAVH